MDFSPIQRIKSWRRFEVKKLRVLMAWIGVGFLFLYSHSNDDGFRVGLPIVILGEMLRIWAGGYLEKKGEILTTNGPYAYVRNPLYVGNFLIGLGVVLISRSVVLLTLFLIGFFILYRKMIQREERELEEKFGQDYHRYYTVTGILAQRGIR